MYVHTVVVYSYMQIHIYIYMQHHNDTINKRMSKGFFIIICTSYFIVRVRKGLLRVLVWEGVGDRTELQYIDLHSYGRQHRAFLVLQGCSTGGPGAQLSAECWLSLPHLVSNLSGPQLIRVPKGPLRQAFSTTSYQQLLWTPTHQGLQGPPPPGFLFHILSATSLTSCLDWVIK